VVLDVQAVFTRCYDNGGYEDFVDYHQPPVSLSSEEMAWAGELAGKGLAEGGVPLSIIMGKWKGKYSRKGDRNERCNGHVER
jgi:hypothetical protein